MVAINAARYWEGDNKFFLFPEKNIENLDIEKEKNICCIFKRPNPDQHRMLVIFVQEIYGIMIALGRHIIIEAFNADPDVINNPPRLEEIFLSAARAANATILSSHFHSFEPQGVSGVIVISESHFTVHSWPEYGYAAVDIFFCDDSVKVDRAIEVLKEKLNTPEIIITGNFNRGVLPSSADFPRKPLESEKKLEKYVPLSWEEKFYESQAKAISASIDLFNVDPYMISRPDVIEQFSADFCRHFNMKIAAEPVITTSDNEDGYSLCQPLQNSLMSAHFNETHKKAYIDIYSSRFYEPRDVSEFCLSYFQAERYTLQVSLKE